MEYVPDSPLATLAVPVLTLDNALALKLLLAQALAREYTPPAAVKVNPNRLGTMDPIAGPLVALSRRLGLLPETEEDG